LIGHAREVRDGLRWARAHGTSSEIAEAEARAKALIDWWEAEMRVGRVRVGAAIVVAAIVVLGFVAAVSTLCARGAW
jgi:hypothetical protein